MSKKQKIETWKDLVSETRAIIYGLPGRGFPRDILRMINIFLMSPGNEDISDTSLMKYQVELMAAYTRTVAGTNITLEEIAEVVYQILIQCGDISL